LWIKTVGSTVLGGLWADFYSSMKTLGATGLGGLWAFWVWHSAETNLRCTATVLGGLWALEYAWHSAETNLRCAGGTLLKQTCAAQEAQESQRSCGQTDGWTD